MGKYILDGQYDSLFRSHGIPVEAALRKADEGDTYSFENRKMNDTLYK